MLQSSRKTRLFLLSSFLLIAVCSTRYGNAQDSKAVNDTLLRDEEDGEILDKVEVEASFPGGDQAWRRFLVQNLDAAVPVNRKAPAGTYTVIIQFVVDKEGGISQIKALTRHGYGMEEEVIRILKKAPHWKPAIQEGRQVKAFRNQPVTFVVMEEEKKKKKKKD